MDFMISEFCEEGNHKIFSTRQAKHETPEMLDIGVMDTRTKLPPEMELGNIEYKARLVNPSPSRLEHLVTQMKWRLREGQGEAIYEIGVEDGGALTGLTDSDMTASLNTLRRMADALKASMVVLTRKLVAPSATGQRRSVVEVLVRKVPENQQFIELRLAVLGAFDVGKSTLCGVLTQGCLDDGNGKTRLNLFRFAHEVRTGKTSSVCLDVFGYDTNGKPVNYADNTLEEMVERSAKIITLIDLAGDSKYLKTTIYGLSGYKPHFACILISAETGATAATREHLGLAAALNIPVFFVITKVDLVDDEQFSRVCKAVSTLIKRAGMIGNPRVVRSSDDAVEAASVLCSDGVVPILQLSSVTGEGLSALHCFIHVLSPAVTSTSRVQLSYQPSFFTVEEVFNVPHVGTVVGGILAEGRLQEGDVFSVGPFRDGSFEKAQIGSIRRCRQPVQAVVPGEAASVALVFPMGGKEMAPLRRGMVLVPCEMRPSSCTRFTANLFLLYHNKRHICVGFQTTVFIGSVCQTATIVDMNASCLEHGQWTEVTFEFLNCPEFIRVGTPLIFRQGKTKGMGEVIDVFTDLSN